MLVLGSVLLTDSMEICLFRITSFGWSQILAEISEGDVCLLLCSIFVARESQCLQWSHFAKSLGPKSELRSPTNNNNSTTTQLRFLRCRYLCVGALFWGNVQPGHSIGPRKLWNAGALTWRRAPVLLVFFAYNEVLNRMSSKTMATEAGQSVQGP